MDEGRGDLDLGTHGVDLGAGTSGVEIVIWEAFKMWCGQLKIIFSVTGRNGVGMKEILSFHCISHFLEARLSIV